MIEILNQIRTPNRNMKMSNKIINSFFILLLGITLGIFSKWLDNLLIDNTIWWQNIFGMLDLRNRFSEFGIWLFIALTISLFSKTPLRASLNVFLFFVGMTTCYHLYTIYFSGFNPMRYMMIWYGITFISPIIAYICWYAKSTNKISIVICSLILYVMLSSSFGIGRWFVDLKNVIDTIIFVGTIIVLYVKPKSTIISVVAALFLSFTFGDIFR